MNEYFLYRLVETGRGALLRELGRETPGSKAKPQAATHGASSRAVHDGDTSQWVTQRQGPIQA